MRRRPRTGNRLLLSDLPAWVLERNGLTAEAKAKRPAKYRNRKAVVDGIAFDSGREAAYYLDLKVRQTAGEIRELRCHPVFELHGAGGKRIGKFTPDFDYILVATDQKVVVDVKSKPTRTEAYMLRKRLFEAEYGIPLTEIY
jgi:hypothetical protein